MTLPIKSRHGLTRCTVCRAHIEAGPRPSETDCPFCGANLARGEQRLHAPSGRGGVLAASLLAFGLTGCGAEEPAAAPDPIAAEEVIVEAEEPPADDRAADPVTVEVPPPAAPPPADTTADGPPPRDPPPPADTTVAENTPDRPVPLPAYGLPPRPPEEPSEPDSFRPQPADDMRPTARYGMAPMRDRDPGLDFAF